MVGFSHHIAGLIRQNDGNVAIIDQVVCSAVYTLQKYEPKKHLHYYSELLTENVSEQDENLYHHFVVAHLNTIFFK